MSLPEQDALYIHDRGPLGELANPHVGHDALDVGANSSEELLRWYRQMLLVRRAEEKIAEMVERGTAKCPCHLAIGQEACAVGIAACLKPTDRAFGAHRSHGHYLALGGDLDKLFAEILGKASGCSGGMGGSMHLIAPEVGLFGTVPIVGATIPMAVGAALSATLDGTGAVATSFFGDGATEEGVFHESMNLAATMKLPVIFVCENNLFSSHLHISLRQPTDSVSRYAAAHRIPSITVDGNDVCAVAAAGKAAVSLCREGRGPAFVELVTYRWRGHVGPREDNDVGVKRGEELGFWKQRDPLLRLRRALVATRGVTEPDLDAADVETRRRVELAYERAESAAYPLSDAVDSFLYRERGSAVRA